MSSGDSHVFFRAVRGSVVVWLLCSFHPGSSAVISLPVQQTPSVGDTILPSRSFFRYGGLSCVFHLGVAFSWWGCGVTFFVLVFCCGVTFFVSAVCRGVTFSFLLFCRGVTFFGENLGLRVALFVWGDCYSRQAI